MAFGSEGRFWTRSEHVPMLKVAFGSKAEKLNASTCFPLYRRKQTSDPMIPPGHFHTWKIMLDVCREGKGVAVTSPHRIEFPRRTLRPDERHHRLFCPAVSCFL
jgi:hypothetical protein